MGALGAAHRPRRSRMNQQIRVCAALASGGAGILKPGRRHVASVATRKPWAPRSGNPSPRNASSDPFPERSGWGATPPRRSRRRVRTDSNEDWSRSESAADAAVVDADDPRCRGRSFHTDISELPGTNAGLPREGHFDVVAEWQASIRAPHRLAALQPQRRGDPLRHTGKRPAPGVCDDRGRRQRRRPEPPRSASGWSRRSGTGRSEATAPNHAGNGQHPTSPWGKMFRFDRLR